MSLGDELDRYLKGLAPAADASQQTLVRAAMDKLHGQPDAPLVDRVSWAVVVCSNGDPENEDATFGQIAEVAGCLIEEVHQALLAQRERDEAA